MAALKNYLHNLREMIQACEEQDLFIKEQLMKGPSSDCSNSKPINTDNTYEHQKLS
jgi:hypothetical protein